MLLMNNLNPHAVRVGVTSVLNILAKWQCSKLQIQSLLQLPLDYESLDIETMSFSQEQLESVSYILNIHAGLNATFSNTENIYGFMNMTNFNSPFNGVTPIKFLTPGKQSDFKTVLDAIDRLFTTP